MIRTRLVAALCAAGFALYAVPTAAYAHAGLTGSTPTAGSTLPVAPGEVTLTFSEDVAEPVFVAVTVDAGASAAETSVVAGKPVVQANVVTQPLAADLAAGEYTAAYRVVSADGHPISGEIGFTVAGTGQPTGEPTSDPTSTAPGASEPTSNATDRSDTTDQSDQSDQDDQETNVLQLALTFLVGLALVGVALVALRKAGRPRE